MDVTVENLEGLNRKITLALPWEGIRAAVDKKLSQTQRKAKVQGFRPGKAPLKMVDAMYGADIRNEVLNDAVVKAFYEVVEAQKLRVAGLPRFNEVENQDDENTFKIDAQFEVFPEVKVGDLSAQEVEKATTEVSDAEVDKTIEILRGQRTRYNHVERAAQKEDRVIIDFAGKIDGVAFDGGSAENYPFVLGQGQMLPEFEAGVEGLKEGESKDVEVSFPEDYHGKEVAGKTAVFTITVRNVSEATLPEVNEEFAKQLGIVDGDVAKMRDEVKKNVSREVNRRVAEKNKAAVMDALLAVTEFDVPAALVQEETGRMMQDARQNFINQGFDAKQLPELPADMFTEQATRRVKLGLILAQLVEEQQLQPTNDDIRDIVAEFAESYEDPAEVIEWYMGDAERQQGPAALATEAKVVEFVLGKAKVTDKVLSFDEVMGNTAA
ncbi:trigger factor [Vitreoscilla massiliensis]|uniref:Trigger factor n=1 Tax=Vitreoscilla massiliensis TaxID=1689272 RepID=A0ABY4DYM7_9NEIS|nr:trigger factor [Vitreoscilla massiliensis]UOO88412.1 trigger factor [Vitreoscilla massiliensis]